jgi:hypothetical protein
MSYFKTEEVRKILDDSAAKAETAMKGSLDFIDSADIGSLPKPLKYDDATVPCIQDGKINEQCIAIAQGCTSGTSGTFDTCVKAVSSDDVQTKNLIMGFLMGKGLESSKIISQIVTGLRLPRTSQMRRCVERGVARNYGQAVSVLSYLSANVSALNGVDGNVSALRTHLISEYDTVVTDKKSLLETVTGTGTSVTLDAIVINTELAKYKPLYEAERTRLYNNKNAWQDRSITVLKPIDKWLDDYSDVTEKGSMKKLLEGDYRKVFETIVGLCKATPEILNPKYFFETPGPSYANPCPSGENDPFGIPFNMAGCELNVQAVQNCGNTLAAGMVNLRDKYKSAAISGNVTPLVRLLSVPTSGIAVAMPVFRGGSAASTPAVEFIAPITYPELKLQWIEVQRVAASQNINIDSIKSAVNKQLEDHREREIKSLKLAYALNGLSKALEAKGFEGSTISDYLDVDVFKKIYDKYASSLGKSYKSGTKCSSANATVFNEVSGSLSITLGDGRKIDVPIGK